MLVSEILNECFTIIKDHFGNEPPKIKSITMGNKFVAMQLDDFSVGLSFLEHDLPYNFPLFNKGKNCDEDNQTYQLAKLAYIGKGMEISYGIATLNALTTSILIHSDRYEYLENSEVIELWKDFLTQGTRVGMVGNMYPLVKILIKRGCEVCLLDKHAEDPGKDPLPKEIKLIHDIKQFNEVDIFIMTGSSLIYHSTENLIENSKKSFLKTIIGPTATLPPEPFWKRGIDFIGGAIASTSYFQSIVAEELYVSGEIRHKKDFKDALKYDQNSGIKKIGFPKKIKI